MDQKTSKYCKHCGELIDIDCVICPKCGKQVEEIATQPPNIVINNDNINTNTNTNVNLGIGHPLRSKTTTLILCIFFGWLGIHRFYTWKSGTGIIWLFTLGLCLIGWIVDIVMIAIGAYRDKFGRPLI